MNEMSLMLATTEDVEFFNKKYIEFISLCYKKSYKKGLITILDYKYFNYLYTY